MSIRQVKDEQAIMRDDQRITREGQITDRYNAAVENLGHASRDVRMGGIYALRRIMKDSKRDQPTIVSVLAAYIRAHTATPQKYRNKIVLKPPTGDIEAAAYVLGTRNTDLDGEFPKLRLSLRDANLNCADLSHADLRAADLADVSLIGASLWRADLRYADLTGADLNSANLTSADLREADLRSANLLDADMDGANLSSAYLFSADLSYRGDACSHRGTAGASRGG